MRTRRPPLKAGSATRRAPRAPRSIAPRAVRRADSIPTRFRPAGFSLAEMMVVLSIVALLTGLLAAGLAQMLESGKKGKVDNMMHQLNAAHTEYRAQLEEVVNIEGDYPMDWTSSNHTKNAPGYDENDTGTPDDAIERFVLAIEQIDHGKELMDSMPKELMVDSDRDGFLEIRDPWGSMLVYRPSNINDGDPATPTFASNLPKHPDPFFASPGPDGVFTAPNQDGPKDDIYSFEIDR